MLYYLLPMYTFLLGSFGRTLFVLSVVGAATTPIIVSPFVFTGRWGPPQQPQLMVSTLVFAIGLVITVPLPCFLATVLILTAPFATVWRRGPPQQPRPSCSTCLALSTTSSAFSVWSCLSSSPVSALPLLGPGPVGRSRLVLPQVCLLVQAVGVRLNNPYHGPRCYIFLIMVGSGVFGSTLSLMMWRGASRPDLQPPARPRRRFRFGCRLCCFEGSARQLFSPQVGLAACFACCCRCWLCLPLPLVSGTDPATRCLLQE